MIFSDVYYYIYNLACLNYLISFLFQSTEEARKAAYDMLIGINSALQESPFATSDGPYEKLVSMVGASLTCFDIACMHLASLFKAVSYFVVHMLPCAPYNH